MHIMCCSRHPPALYGFFAFCYPKLQIDFFITLHWLPERWWFAWSFLSRFSETSWSLDNQNSWVLSISYFHYSLCFCCPLCQNNHYCCVFIHICSSCLDWKEKWIALKYVESFNTYQRIVLSSDAVSELVFIIDNILYWQICFCRITAPPPSQFNHSHWPGSSPVNAHVTDTHTHTKLYAWRRRQSESTPLEYIFSYFCGAVLHQSDSCWRLNLTLAKLSCNPLILQVLQVVSVMLAWHREVVEISYATLEKIKTSYHWRSFLFYCLYTQIQQNFIIQSIYMKVILFKLGFFPFTLKVN